MLNDAGLRSKDIGRGLATVMVFLKRRRFQVLEDKLQSSMLAAWERFKPIFALG
jgi:hypothetical protein